MQSLAQRDQREVRATLAVDFGRDVSEVVALINDHRRRVGEGRCRASGEPPVEQEQMVVGHQELRAPGGLFGLQGKALQLE